MIQIKHQGKIIASQVVMADNPWLRLMGYMFRSHPHQAGILFEPCHAIHTCFMFFDIDVVFLTKNNEVIKVIRNLRPWRHTWFYFKARKTLELPAGKLPPEVREGDVWEVEHV